MSPAAIFKFFFFAISPARSIRCKPAGIALLILLAIVIVLLMCFAAGLLARRSFGKRIAEAFEKKLLLLFPRYAILKDQMADSIGGDAAKAKIFLAGKK